MSADRRDDRGGPASREAQPRSLDQFVDLGRSSLDSHLRAHLAQADVSPAAPVFVRLKSFLSMEFVRRGLKFLKVFFSRRCRFQDYPYGQGENGIFPLVSRSDTETPDDVNEIRLSLAGDWGTGTREAESVAENMLKFDPHYTIHLGDVYYVGSDSEVREHCLKESLPGDPFTPVDWPHGSLGSFALSGNHEMYSNGSGYFGHFLPTLGMGPSKSKIDKPQRASFFCLHNSHWMFLGLDTGYNSVGWASIFSLCKLETALMTWLEDRVRPQEFEGSIVLLTHHQCFSNFERGYGRPARQLRKFFKNRSVLWFWGHEHRFAIYGKHQACGGVPAFARCIGHGGMPVSLGSPSKFRGAPLVLYDEREYLKLSKSKVGFNGYANLKCQGATLEIEYYTLKRDLRAEPTLVASETWESSGGHPVGRGIRKTPGFLTQVADLSLAQH